ncbi:hypothetical protein BV20DRAFT_958125 [Pilatotrama ljubarskyi]|nr:hypothetical protein BV20DRAFT_958125 [Pilatotrama ljubarskyi]
MVLTLLAVFGVLFATTQPSSGGVLDVVDDADPRVQYTGSWVPYTAVNSTQFWSGTVTYTNISGAMAKLAFTGDSVQVFGAFNLSGHLNMSSRYTLDDATPVMFSPPSVVETPIFRRQFYASGLIAFGQHVLTIENLGEQFWLDSIHVDGPNGTLSSVSVMQSNTVLTTQAHPTPSSSADDPATTQPVRAPSAGGTSTVSGVVAGAVVAGILLVSMLLGGLWWRRRQRRMRQAVPPGKP